MSQDKSILYNTSFLREFDGWKAEGTSLFFTSSGRFIYGNSKPLSYMVHGARLCREDDRAVLYIRNGAIIQSAETFATKPTLTQVEEDGEIKVRPISVYYSFMYKASEDCDCKVLMEGADASINAKDEVFTPIVDNFTLYKSDEWTKVSGELKYNGSGSFKVSILNGNGAYVYNLVLGTDSADILAARYRTLFAQSDRLITLSAAAFDKDGDALSESGIVIQDNFLSIFSGNKDIRALISVYVQEDVSHLKLKADQISLEGYTTINGGFVVDEQGTISAENATFTNCSVVNSTVSGNFTSKSDKKYGNVVRIEENASAFSMTAPLKIDASTLEAVGDEKRTVFTTSFGSLIAPVEGGISTRYAWSEWYGSLGYMNIGNGYGFLVSQAKPGDNIYQQWAHLNYDSLVLNVDRSTGHPSKTTITAGAVEILDENGDASLTTKGLTIKGSKGRVRITDVGIEILDASGNVTKTILFSKILTN